MAQTTSLVFNGGSIPSPAPTPSGTGKAKLLKIGEITITEQGVQVTKKVICDPDSVTTVAPFMEVLTSAKLAELVNANSVLVLDYGDMQYLMADARITVEDETPVCTSVSFLGLSRENRAKVEYPCVRVTDELTLQQVVEVGDPVETDFNRVLADSDDTDPKTLIDKMEVTNSYVDPEDPESRPILKLETMVDEQGNHKVAINENDLWETFGDISAELDHIEDTLEDLPGDEHGYFNSSLVETPGDGTTTSISIDSFRVSNGRDVSGESIEFVPTHQEGDIDYGDVYLNPGTYIVTAHYTLQWVGNPRGTFLPLVTNVLSQPFDFSYEHEDIVRATRIVTRTSRQKLTLDIGIEADTPKMGVWVKYLEIAQISSYIHPAVAHDTTLTGNGKPGDPLGVTPAAFGKIKNIPTSISQFRTGDVIPVDGPNGTAKMAKNDLLKETAQNALAGNLAPAFDPTRTNDKSYNSGENVVFNGTIKTFSRNHYGPWDENSVYVPQSVTELMSAMKACIENAIDDTLGVSNQKVYATYYENAGTPSSNASAPYIIDVDVSRYIIHAIALKIVKPGTLSIGICRKVPTDSMAFVDTDIDFRMTVHIESTGYKVIELPDPLVISQDNRLCICKPDDTAKWTIGGDRPGYHIWFAIVNNSYKKLTSAIGIDVFGYCLAALTDELTFLEDGCDPKTDTVLDGLTSQHLHDIDANIGPFVFDKSFGKDIYLNSLELTVVYPGTLTVSVVKQAKVHSGGDCNIADYSVKETFNIKNAGHQILDFSSKIKVRSDEFLAIGHPGDSMTFKYGHGGSDNGFYRYIEGGEYNYGDSSLNMAVTAWYYSKRLGSIYEGKSISILGDSISTFTGYIPNDYPSHYPSGDVQSVSNTWWEKLILALGMTLDINNSYSGSMVSTRRGASSAGCGLRSQQLGTSPSVIIVWMGVNDFNGSVPLGTYSGKGPIPSTTTTFREAYGIMLNNILTNYPRSEVFVCTLPHNGWNGSVTFPNKNNNDDTIEDFNSAIRDLANAFGVKVLDINKCGITYQNVTLFLEDRLHPNKFGHSLVANYIIHKMDNIVRTVYSTT